ncbi:MAG: hypothetical protein ACI8X5_003760 [Planctomycetota bacterium]|jgi:hypothetical protein
MGKLIKEYWIWVVAPLVLIFAGVGILIYMEGQADGGGESEFVYDLF